MTCAAILFGSAVVVEPGDLYMVGAATVLLLGGHAVLWRALLFAGYDPMGARVQGMPVRALNVFLFLSVGLSVALCTRALGALPVFAFSVLPAMTALALTARIGLVFVLATLIGALSGVGGYVVSFRGDLPVGATQTATAAALLAAALAFRFVRARYDRAGEDDVGAANGRGVEPGAQRQDGGVVQIAGAADRAAPALRGAFGDQRGSDGQVEAPRHARHRDAEHDVRRGDRLAGQAVVLVADHHRRRAREVQILDGRRRVRHRRIQREAVGAQRRHGLARASDGGRRPATSRSPA